TEASQYKEHFPTLATAEMAKIAAEDFHDVESKYFGSTDPTIAAELRKQMWEGDLVRDQNGEPLRNADGTFQVHGRYDHFFHDYRQNDFYPQLLRVAAQHGREAEIGEALAVIQEFLGEEPVTAVAPKTAETKNTDDSRLRPQEREALAELDRLKREQAQAKQGETEAYHKSVLEATTTSLNGFLLTRVQRMAPALSASSQQKVVSDALKEIGGLALGTKLFEQQRASILAKGGEEAKKRYVAEMLRFTEARYAPILQSLVAEYAQPVVAASADKRAKLDTQKTQAAVKGGAGVPSPSRQDESDLIAEGDKLSQKLYGRSLRDFEILDIAERIPELRAKAAAKARRA
ncbi:MAG: hypothetical protein M3O09_09640, partial [Acidobacteriota bacterium]|nr:hypothetical protein [Acidobacteriota bacterium]